MLYPKNTLKKNNSSEAQVQKIEHHSARIDYQMTKLVKWHGIVHSLDFTRIFKYLLNALTSRHPVFWKLKTTKFCFKILTVHFNLQKSQTKYAHAILLHALSRSDDYK